MLEVPIRASLGFNYEEGRKVRRPVAKTLRESDFCAPGLFQLRNTSPGVSLELCAEETVHLLASTCVVNKMSALQNQLTAKENICVRNLSPVSLSFRQVDFGVSKALASGASCAFVWPCPSALLGGGREALQVKVNAKSCGWSDKFQLTKDCCFGLALPISEAHEVQLSV